MQRVVAGGSKQSTVLFVPPRMRAVPLAIVTARPGKPGGSGRAAKKSFKAIENSHQRKEGVGLNARRQRKVGPLESSKAEGNGAVAVARRLRSRSYTGR
jgi:hypothetical protein